MTLDLKGLESAYVVHLRDCCKQVIQFQCL